MVLWKKNRLQKVGVVANTSPLPKRQGLPPKIIKIISSRVSPPSLRYRFSKLQYWQPKNDWLQIENFESKHPCLVLAMNKSPAKTEIITKQFD